jgi:hypothetical protein
VSAAAARVGTACVAALSRMAAHRAGAGEVAAAAAGNARVVDRVVPLAGGGATRALRAAALDAVAALVGGCTS